MGLVMSVIGMSQCVGLVMSVIGMSQWSCQEGHPVEIAVTCHKKCKFCVKAF